MDPEPNLKNAYMEAYKMACEQLARRDAQEVCMNTKAAFDAGTGVYTLRYFGLERRIRCAGGIVDFCDDKAELETTEKILTLHYLTHARPAPLSGRLISFKEIPGGGAIYYPTFKKRTIDPLVRTFSGDPGGLYEAAGYIGGARESLGDVSVVVNIFPLVPVTYVIWKGDEEIPPSGTVLFDSSVPGFLPVEDIVVAAANGTHRLICGWKRGKQGFNENSCIR